ncbi:hypothetical protein ABIC01_004367 [Bradyrhizobium sp. RT4b]
MANHNISRRTLLTGTAAAGALSLTGLPARAEVNWKKYAGTKLEVILAKGPRGDNLQKTSRSSPSSPASRWNPNRSPSSNSARKW